MAKDVVIPKGMEAYYNDYHFGPAVKDGDRLFCSGQLGTGEGNKISDDAETQFTQAFENVKTTLEAAGSSFDDVVEMKVAVLVNIFLAVIWRHKGQLADEDLGLVHLWAVVQTGW